MEFTARTATIFERFFSSQLEKVKEGFFLIEDKYWDPEDLENKSVVMAHGWVGAIEYERDPSEDEPYEYERPTAGFWIRSPSHPHGLRVFLGRNVLSWCMDEAEKIAAYWAKATAEVSAKLRSMIGKKYYVCSCGTTCETPLCGECAAFLLPHPTGDSCPICLSDGEAVWVKTECGHVFHHDCWNKVIKKGRLRTPCPLCRTECISVEKV